MSQVEEYLGALANGAGSSELPSPTSRIEKILKAIIDGDDSSTLEPPSSRVEELLIEVLETISSGGGGGGGGDVPVPSKDGKTHFIIYIDPKTPSVRKSFTLRWNQSEGNGVVVNWGDGSDEQSYSDIGYAVNHSHEYSKTGWFDISLEVVDGTISFEGTSGSSGYSVFGKRGAGSNNHNKGRILFVEFGDNVSEIGQYAFTDCCSLFHIGLGTGITSIGSHAFESCSNLTYLTVPNTVTAIGDNTFNDCDGIFTYHLKSTTPPTLSNSNAFSSMTSDARILVPYASVDTYKAATNWSSLSDFIEGEST